MNKEFEEWLDREIKKRSPDGAMTKAVLGDIITKALTELANVEEMKNALQRAEALKSIVEQVKITHEEMIASIRKCCSGQAGNVFCDRYGCGDLRRLATQLQAALNVGDLHVP